MSLVLLDADPTCVYTYQYDRVAMIKMLSCTALINIHLCRLGSIDL